MSILVAYVPTPVGEAALEAGIREARLREEVLVIANSQREGALTDASAASAKDLSEALERARAAGVEAEVSRPTHRDDLADTILDLAEEQDVSLIVLGLRRRSQVGKLLMGSHAQRILLQADRPVLSVKAT